MLIRGGNILTKIKLIASDIDGTLFDSEHNYDVKRFNNYLDLLHQKDIKFAVASGNNRDHLEKIFQQSPNIDVFIAENGAQIYNQQETLYEKTLPNTLVNDMIKTFDKELELKALSLSGKKASYSNTAENQPLYHINNLVCVDDLTKINDEIFKLNIQLQHEDLDTGVELLNEKYGSKIYAAVSGFGSIEIMSNNVNKSLGLQHLCQKLDLSLKNVMSFGDNTNDLEMLAESGISFAMKNAKPKILKTADHITKDDNDHDGVLNTLAEFFQL